MKKLLIIILFFLGGCVDYSVKDLDLFEALLKIKIADANKVIILNNDDINTGKFIVYPPNAWVPLLEFHQFDQKSCLAYKVPFSLNRKDQLGTIALFDLPLAGGCLDQVTQMPIAELKDIYNFSFALAQEEQRYNNFPQKVPAFNLALRFEKKWPKEKNEKIVLVPLVNLKQGTLFENSALLLGQEERPVIYSKRARFESSASAGLITGFNIIRTDEKIKLLGDFFDSYQQQNAIICHDIDDNCKEVSAFECHKCKFGWFETIRANCEQGGPKFCGLNRCGEKGEPACLKGKKLIKEEMPCYNDSKLGFCSPGLHTVCDENKILICL